MYLITVFLSTVGGLIWLRISLIRLQYRRLSLLCFGFFNLKYLYRNIILPLFEVFTAFIAHYKYIFSCQCMIYSIILAELHEWTILLAFTVEGGHRAVIFDRFRGVLPNVSGEGTHFIIPWVQRPIVFDIRSRPRNVPVTTGSKGKNLCLINYAIPDLSWQI